MGRDSLRTMLAWRRWIARREVSSRSLLLAFMLFVSAAIIAVFAVETLHARDIAIANARQSAVNITESIANQTSDTYEAVDAVLLSVDQHIQNDGLGPTARIRLRDALAALVTTMPRLHRLDVFDSLGKSVVSNVSATANLAASVADRPYFQYHRSHPGSSLHISGPKRAKTDKAWVIFATRRLDRADGNFAGVLIAPISLSYFDEMFAKVDIGPLGTIKIIADDGTLMARKPHRYIGSDLRHDALFLEPYAYESAGTFFAASPLDGIPRLHAFRRLGQYPLVVEVGLAESEYLANWRADAIKGGLAAVALLVMIGGLAAKLGAQIARSKRAEEDLSRLALIDGLTGLANRRRFDELFEREWRRAERERTSLAVLMIDVDSFKSYNDVYGHSRGDAALIAIARAIAANAREPSDVAARYGGEEFVVVLPGTDAHAAVTVAERIRSAVVRLAIPHADARNGVGSVSIGVASIVPSGATSPAALIDAADRALYDAKRTGRDRVALTGDASAQGPGPAIRA